MGVAFKDLIESKEIDVAFLSNKVLLLDAHNILYQFLTTIRGRDGSLLKDSNGNVTSHLVGLFTRMTHLIQRNLRLAFVFDGKAPELKRRTIENRKLLKIEAQKKFEEAQKKEDLEEMRKYASRTTRLTQDMILESKKLIGSLGMPVVDAPSEGEAQAAYMVRKSEGFAVGSQDFDSLVYGSTKLVRNLSISGKRKRGGKIGYETVRPELITLSENLNKLGIDQNQLIALAMLVGTDYNLGGIKGIGPKNALKLVKKYKGDFDSLFTELKWEDNFDFPWTDVYYLIKKIPITEKYDLKWKEAKESEVYKILVEDHDFSEERVASTLKKLVKYKTKMQQKSMSDF